MSRDISKRVLHVTTGLKFGGVETLLLEVLPLLKNNGWDVHLICLRFGDLVPLFNQRGFFPVCLNARKGNPAIPFWMRQEIEAFSPDLLHVHLFESEVMTLLATTGMSIPQIVTRHNPENFRLSPVIRQINHALNTRFRYVVTISDAVAEFCHIKENIPSGKILRIHNAIDLDRFKPLTVESRRDCRGTQGWTENLVVGTVGRLTYQKGHKYLIDAWPYILRSFPNAILIIIGGGELREELEGQCEKLGIRSSVQFLGNRWDDLTDILGSIDLFVFPSIFEGLGNAVLEAMAMGLPVVASEVDGLLEIINDQTGVFVPPADSVALAQATIALLGNASERKRMGDAARRSIAAKFDIHGYVADLLDVYSAVLEDRKPRADLFVYPEDQI